MPRLNGLPKKSKKDSKDGQNKNFDVMNPEAVNPTAKKTMKNIAKALTKWLKLLQKL